MGSNNKSKLISVVMAVYNGEKYLIKSIESILHQTFPFFELIIIDDGSMDGSLGIIEHYACLDNRIKLVVNKENLGLAKSLNKGIALAEGEFIARMDADDVSLRDRFQIQWQFLNDNPHIDLVGSWVEYIDQTSQPTGKVSKYPGSPMGLRWSLLFLNHIWHPTVMVRRDFFRKFGLYDEKLDSTQDYALWAKNNFSALYANIQEVLLQYRDHDKNISKSRRSSQRENLCQISQQTISNYLGTNIDTDTIKLIIFPKRIENKSVYFSAIQTLRKLHQNFVKDHRLTVTEKYEVNLHIANRYSQIAKKNFHYPSSWFIRIYAISLVLYSLALKFAAVALLKVN